MIDYMIVSYILMAMALVISYISGMVWFSDTYNSYEKKKASLLIKRTLIVALFLPLAPLAAPAAVCYVLFIGLRRMTQSTISVIRYNS